MKLELHPKPKQPIQLNRPLIITVAIVVVIGLLLAIIGALTTTNRVKTSSVPTTSKVVTDQLVVSPEITALPGDYSDVNGIRKYSVDLSSNQLTELLQQFNELQNEYANLKQQLLGRREESAPERKLVDPDAQEARKSDMTFKGLGSGVDSLIGGQSDKGKPFSSGNQEELVATPAQEEFFKQQAHNTQKLAAWKGRDNPEDIYDMHNIAKPASKYQVQAGTIIPATLITAIDSTLDGTVIAQVRSNVYDTVTGKYLLVPKGSKLLGEYSSRIATGQRRVLLAFNRIVRPDGTSILLGKMFGADAAGQSGVEANVDNHWARIIGSATISTILGGAAGIAGDTSGSDKDSLPSMRYGMTRGITSSISNIGQDLVRRDMFIPPTLKLPFGHQFNVTVRKDMILNPYKQR